MVAVVNVDSVRILEGIIFDSLEGVNKVGGIEVSRPKVDEESGDGAHGREPYSPRLSRSTAAPMDITACVPSPTSFTESAQCAGPVCPPKMQRPCATLSGEQCVVDRSEMELTPSTTLIR